jgi:splicing factor 45
LQQGHGLGRSEQGMAMALSVEKTSKRGGRIVHEKDLMPPPMFGESFKTPQPQSPGGAATPPNIEDTDEYDDPIAPPIDDQASENKPSITDLMKNPCKVIVCKVCSISILLKSNNLDTFEGIH